MYNNQNSNVGTLTNVTFSENAASYRGGGMDTFRQHPYSDERDLQWQLRTLGCRHE